VVGDAVGVHIGVVVFVMVICHGVSFLCLFSALYPKKWRSASPPGGYFCEMF